MEIAGMNWVEIVSTVGVAVGGLFMRKITSALSSVASDFKQLRDLPSKMEETTQRIEKKYDRRFEEMEKIREAQDKKLDLLIETIAHAPKGGS